jgi:hypothetical protein
MRVRFGDVWKFSHVGPLFWIILYVIFQTNTGECKESLYLKSLYNKWHETSR